MYNLHLHKLFLKILMWDNYNLHPHVLFFNFLI